MLAKPPAELVVVMRSPERVAGEPRASGSALGRRRARARPSSRPRSRGRPLAARRRRAGAEEERRAATRRAARAAYAIAASASSSRSRCGAASAGAGSGVFGAPAQAASSSGRRRRARTVGSGASSPRCSALRRGRRRRCLRASPPRAGRARALRAAPAGRPRAARARPRRARAARLVVERRRSDRTAGVDDHRGLDLRGDLRQVGERLCGVHGADTVTAPDTAGSCVGPLAPSRSRSSSPTAAPHLAAMIAYFALLSFVPLLFLALALLGFTGRAEESSYLVEELKRAFPAAVDRRLVASSSAIQRTRRRSGSSAARSCSGLARRSSACSSRRSTSSTAARTGRSCAGRRSRSLLHGRLARRRSSPGSSSGSSAFDLAAALAPGFVGNGVVAYGSRARLDAALFLFLVVAYQLLTNATPDAAGGAAGRLPRDASLLQASFQVLPLFVRLSSDVVALQALGALGLLLVWLYVMANVIVLRRRGELVARAATRGERRRGVAGLGLGRVSCAHESAAPRGRGASAAASTRRRARRPSAPRRRGTKIGS